MATQLLKRPQHPHERTVYEYDDGSGYVKVKPGGRERIILEGTVERMAPYYEAIAKLRSLEPEA